MQYTYLMRDLLIIFGMIVAAIAVGAALFFYGPSTFRSATGTAGNVSFRLLKEGTNAITITDRANYEIQNQAQLNELWAYIQGTPGAAPTIDFNKEEVLAVFDGTHASGGFSIDVDHITDQDGVRMVHVVRMIPGANCVLTDGITSPYQIVAVPKTDFALSHEDQTITRDCR